MQVTDEPHIPAMTPADIDAHTASSHVRTPHRDDVPGLPPTPRPGTATANTRTCDGCGTPYSGESCPNCRTRAAASYVRALAGSAA